MQTMLLETKWTDAPAEPLRLWIVDDNPAVAEMAAAMAATLFGARTSVFYSPRQALATLHAAPETCDVVLTDFHMPEMTGRELAQRVRELRPGLPIVMMSGDATMDGACGGVAPPVEFLRKPFFVAELGEALRAAAACRERALAT